MKNLKISIIIAIICVTAAITAMYFLGDKSASSNKNVFGNLPKDFGKISISSAQSDFDIMLNDGYWKIPQENNYYANSIVLRYLFESFAKAKLTQKVDINPEEKDLINIKVYSKDNTLLSDVDIFGEQQNKYARVDGKIYLVSNLFNLPSDSVSWMEQPVVEIAEEFIQAIESNDFKSYRNDYFAPFEGDVSFISNQDLFKAVNFLFFTKVVKKDDFNYADVTKNHIRIINFDGLITDLAVYTNGTDYWLEKKISPAVVTKKGINEHIKSREFLYNDWVFQIPPIRGKQLIEYTNYEKRK